MVDEASEQQPITDGQRIAIIEDDLAVADAIAATIGANGWVPMVYATAESFISTLDDADAPGCIILDLHLPGMSGVDVLHTLSDRNQSIPAIVLTAHPDGPLTMPAFKAGIVALYTKPISSEVLIGSIKRAIGYSS
ncbi:MAG TPA: response regulator [Gammaproteobacteria bacterium]|jgi:FixJ family two-component response regulator|nr:response regulator [Gammaproteobacteria bacterium]